MGRLLRLLKDFRRDRRGASLLEFALIAPALMTAAWGVMEVTTILMVSSQMEGAAREAARAGITGYAPDGVDRVTYIKGVVAQNTAGLLDINKLVVDTKIYSSFQNIGMPEPFSDAPPYNGTYDAGEPFTDVNGNGAWDSDMGAAGLGGPGDIVVYTLTYDWPLLSGFGQHILAESGIIKLRATVTVRNEPY